VSLLRWKQEAPHIELIHRFPNAAAQATGLEVGRADTECSTLGNFAVQLAALEAPLGVAAIGEVGRSIIRQALHSLVFGTHVV
jgi:hypothetical protein